MKKKLSAIIIAIMIILTVSLIMPLLSQFSNLTLGLNRDAIQYLANEQAAQFKNQEDTHMTVLRTLANIMGDYENFPAQERRDTFDSMLFTVLKAETDITSIFTVWKPNAIDGMDSRFIGRPGSSPFGQYAVTYTRRNSGDIIVELSKDIEDIMAYLISSDAGKERVDTVYRTRNAADDAFPFYTMMVPIINPKTNAAVGVAGCVLTTRTIQKRLENAMKESDAISAMSVYAGDGTILGSYVPERIGLEMAYVDTVYGNYLQEAVRAVQEGWQFQCSAYSPVLKSNVELIIVPFTAGNSDTTWSIMIAASDDYMLLETRTMTRFTFVLVLIALIFAAWITYIVIHRTLPN